MTDVLAAVREHLLRHFAEVGIESEPEVASVTFLGVDRLDVLRFGPDSRAGFEDVYHYVSLGCSRYPMTDPAAPAVDLSQGPRAELAISLRGAPTPAGLVRSLAVLAATPAVEGVVLEVDALMDLSGPLWTGAPFTAVLLADSGIPALALEPSLVPVQFLKAVPVSQVEAGWIRLKGAEAMRQAWFDDGVDVLNPLRAARQPGW